MKLFSHDGSGALYNYCPQDSLNERSDKYNLKHMLAMALYTAMIHLSITFTKILNAGRSFGGKWYLVHLDALDFKNVVCFFSEGFLTDLTLIICMC